jgi:hypothetical protein
MCGIRVPVFPPAPGKPEFLAGLDQRKLLNVVKIAIEIPVA